MNITLGLLVLVGCTNNVKTYQVFYDLQGAPIEIPSEKKNEGDRVIEPVAPHWEGYVFGSWYQDLSFNEDARWLFSSNVVKKDITLYAKWTVVSPIIVEKTKKVFLVGTLDEFDVYRFDTKISGPTIFIIGGIHGDERAGWNAALNMLNYSFTKGIIYVLPVASQRASYSSPPKRYFETDLNRAFPGKISGTSTEQLAYYLYLAIKETKPDVVLDLHESRGSYKEGYLGDEIIVHDGLYNLYIHSVLNQLNNLKIMLGETKFRLDSAPPVGSINREFTEREGIPVFTLETNRGNGKGTIEQETVNLEKRILQQLAIINIILNDFEVIL